MDVTVTLAFIHSLVTTHSNVYILHIYGPDGVSLGFVVVVVVVMFMIFAAMIAYRDAKYWLCVCQYEQTCVFNNENDPITALRICMRCVCVFGNSILNIIVCGVDYMSIQFNSVVSQRHWHCLGILRMSIWRSRYFNTHEETFARHFLFIHFFSLVCRDAQHSFIYILTDSIVDYVRS